MAYINDIHGHRCEGSDIVISHLNASGFYSGRNPSLETQIERLAVLVGKICDQKGINLLELIDRDELGGKFSVAST